ncbi:MAG: methyltransferase [Flavobacteriales bacterium]|nr:methyltransferase [Flavobacteriales bacterium]
MKVSSPFVFKKFVIRQHHAAFKVGTDSVLLGSWVTIPKNINTIVDIGTGTGVLALMMAQRCDNAIIHAVEIDPLSAKDAEYNFESSPWKDRIVLHIENFSNFHAKNLLQVDLVITNPPYFNHSLKNNDIRISRARHVETLSFQNLWQAALQIMHSQATLALILPVHEMEQFTTWGERRGWYMHRRCLVSSFKDSQPIRTLAEFRQGKPNQLDETILYLYQRDGQRSEAYNTLTTDFYL